MFLNEINDLMYNKNGNSKLNQMQLIRIKSVENFYDDNNNKIL